MGGVQASPKHFPAPPLHFLFSDSPIRFLGATGRDLSTDNHNATFRSSRWLKGSKIKGDRKLENRGPEMFAPKQEVGASCSSLLFTKHPKVRYSDKGE